MDRRVIGVDFDNTLVTYDELLHEVAVERGLIPATEEKSKKAIRDRVRRLRGGEVEWQRLQAVVYGPRIGEARLIDGVREFLLLCRQAKVTVYVISHKTEFAAYDETRTNLRLAALQWMGAHGFFEPNGLGLSPRAVFFGTTRLEKIEYIGRLGCTHFIDDLEETFQEEGFPRGVEKILYAPHWCAAVGRDVKILANWGEICAYLFG